MIIKEFLNIDGLAVWVWCKNYGELRFSPCKYCNCDFIGLVSKELKKLREDDDREER